MKWLIDFVIKKINWIKRIPPAKAYPFTRQTRENEGQTTQKMEEVQQKRESSPIKEILMR